VNFTDTDEFHACVQLDNKTLSMMSV